MQGNRQKDCKTESMTRADGSFEPAWNDCSHYLGNIVLIRFSKYLTFDEPHVVACNVQVEGSV